MRRRVGQQVTLALLLLPAVSAAANHSPAEQQSAAVQIATFLADITPALGEVIDCGLSPESRARLIEHPLHAKGVVLKDAGGVYVLCAFDWESINNDAHDFVRQKLADAAGVMALQPMALQLRYLQSLVAIASEKKSTTIFPMPIDLLTR